ncbi:MAG: restriction endonuclease subunit S [Chloroflexi bacterium]|nr:restriction endonuclease subunit S [Chloroflexota bacterium]
MTALPEGWIETILGEVVKPRNEKALPINLGAIQFIGMDDIESQSFKLLGSKPIEQLRSAVAVFEEGDVLYGRLRPYLNKVYVAEFAGAASAEFIILPSSVAIVGKYLLFLLGQRDFVEFAMMRSTGDRPRVNFEAVCDYPISLPPLAEQHRIVAKLDALFARTRQAREEVETIPTLIEHYKQAILAAAFRGELTAEWRSTRIEIEPAIELVNRIPEPQQPRGGREATDTVIEGRAALSVNVPERPAPNGWAWVPLLRIARQETGHTPSRKHPEYWDGDIPWIGIRDAGDHHGSLIMDTYQHVTEEGLVNSSARLLPKDTICLSRTASVGYIVRMGRDMATSQDFVTWTCSEAIDPDYLLYALLAEGDDIRRFGKGSTHTTIYFPEVRALHICLAPLEEQREIVKRVKAALDWVDSVAYEVSYATELLPQLESAMLGKAFRGELVPQDPNDEPASILLERIREARAEQSNGNRRQKRK